MISGEVGAAKPDPRIYQALVERHGLDPASLAFVDDVPANVAAAESLGMRGLTFTSAAALRQDLAALGLPIA